MNKRIISLCLALVLLLCLLPSVPTAAAEEEDVAINETNFPDEIFRAYVSEFDNDENGLLSAEEASWCREIYVENLGIGSLQGIEFFPDLTLLSCYNNQLTGLDVSQNKNLEYLYCWENQIRCLEFYENTALKELDCGSNQLWFLDVSKNTALEKLYCYDNQLKELDVSKNTALTQLLCLFNQLTELDVSQNTALTWLYCYNNQLTELDVSKNTSLTELYCSDNQLTELDISKNTALELLECKNCQLTSLDVSRNTELSHLVCSCNQLTELDVSQNTELTWLDCSCNQLTALDLRNNAALPWLWCYRNNINVLDISAVPKLLDALENGDVHIGSRIIKYSTTYSRLEMDRNQKTIPAKNPFLDVKADDFFYDAVLWAYRNDITAGMSKTEFSPYKTCTREQVITFLWRAKGCPEPTDSNSPFQDVPNGRYYTKAVLWAVENGITNGKSKTKFGVGDPCTRGQVVTFLWRAEGEPEPTSAANPFKDVSETDYFYKAVLWAVENGITNGTSKTKFSPAKTCTRGQVVTFLYRDVVGAE